MRPSCKSCVLFAIVVTLAVLVGYAAWVGGREAFAGQGTDPECQHDTMGYGAMEVDKPRERTDEAKRIFVQTCIANAKAYRKQLKDNAKTTHCTLTAYFGDANDQRMVIEANTSRSALHAFFTRAYDDRYSRQVKFDTCAAGFESDGNSCQSRASNVISGGSQGCNQHESDTACLNDDRCVLYRKHGGSGKTICYPKCPTIKNVTDCNDNSQSFCAYKDGKCGYKCSEFNAKSTFDNSRSPNACAMASGCKVEGDECVSKDARASTSDDDAYAKRTEMRREYDASIGMDDDDARDTDAGETKQTTAELVVENDPTLPVFEVLGANDEPVGKLPKCYTDYEKAVPSEMAKGGEGAFLCKDKGVCMDSQMVGVLGGFLDLKGEALVGEINRRCGNNEVPVMQKIKF